jgi:hypothetical protein
VPVPVLSLMLVLPPRLAPGSPELDGGFTPSLLLPAKPGIASRVKVRATRPVARIFRKDMIVIRGVSIIPVKSP